MSCQSPPGVYAYQADLAVCAVLVTVWRRFETGLGSAGIRRLKTQPRSSKVKWQVDRWVPDPVRALRRGLVCRF